jgi:molybdate transport system ATP-binding protein
MLRSRIRTFIKFANLQKQFSTIARKEPPPHQEEHDWLIRMKDVSIKPYLPINSYSMKSPPIVLKQINFQLLKTEHWLCVGSNGSGKSTFVRALTGKGIITSGYVESSIKTTNIISFQDHERMKLLSTYFQSHEADLREEGLTVESFLKDNEITIDETFALFCNYHELKRRSLSSLSSGEFRRILIVRALLQKPDLLILDEAFDFLDVEKRKVLAHMLNSFVKQNPKTRIMMVTHREADVDEIDFLTNKIVFGSGGQISYIGKLENKRNIFAHQVMDKSLPSTRPTVKFQAEVNELIQATLDLYGRDMKAVSQVSVNSRIPIVEINKLHLAYYGDVKCTFEQESLRIYPTDRVFLSGPSGAGKSLLLSLILGENPQAYSNDVLVFGKMLGGYTEKSDTLENRRNQIGMFSPSMAESKFLYNKHKTSIDVVLSAFEVSHQNDKSYQLIAQRWTDLFLSHVGSNFSQTYATLSQGQRTAVLLARAFIKLPKLIILDEPFAGLDPEARVRVSETIEKVLAAKQDCAVIATSHYSSDFPYFERKFQLSRPEKDGKALPYYVLAEVRKSL